MDAHPQAALRKGDAHPQAALRRGHAHPQAALRSAFPLGGGTPFLGGPCGRGPFASGRPFVSHAQAGLGLSSSTESARADAWHQRGFSLITGLFLLVVLALLGVFIMAVFGLQQSAQALDVGGSRGHAAARAGIEWGLMQVLDPDNNDARLLVPGNPQPPDCFATQTLPLGGTLAGYVLSVTCSPTVTTELNRNLAVYTITATATTATGTAFAVERQVTATVGRCTDPTGVAPRYACP